MTKFLWLITLPALFLSACGPGREAVTVDPQVEVTNRLKAQLYDAQLGYEYLSGRMQVEANAGGKKTSFKSDIRMKKGEVIWISVTAMFNIEVARAIITPDSIKIVDRVHRIAYVEGFDYLQQEYQVPVDFVTLQSLLVGNIINEPRNSEIEDMENQPMLISEDGQLRVTSYFSPALLLSRVLVAELNGGRSLRAEYSEYGEAPKPNFAMNRTITVNAEESLTADIRFTKVEFEGPLSFPFTISNNYEIAE